MSAIIFAGPTLPPRLRPDDRELTWRPPVRQGELYRAAREGSAIIGVVDGYFEVTPTVWHKEILWAMAAGVHVFGAASIGALRAAELDRFGMRGVGRVYEGFRDGALEDDDEVAVLHGPEELGYPLVTDAMVDIRATVEAAHREGVIGAASAVALTEAAKALFYKQRTYAAMLDRAEGIGDGERAAFAQWLPRGRVERKRLDAEAMIAAIRAEIGAGVASLRVSYTLAESAAWRAARRRADGVT
ncbi:MAG TPA: TfuA-like protein [Stellaceae bacterium]|jgi:hypothetical protein|nr:TfuA-like protein [Stellaceae bacterium]